MPDNHVLRSRSKILSYGCADENESVRLRLIMRARLPLKWTRIVCAGPISSGAAIRCRALSTTFFVGLDWSMKAQRRTTATQKFSWENFGRYFVAGTAPNQIPHKRAYLGTRQ